MRVDEILPKVHGREEHSITLDAPADEVLRVAAQVTWKEVPRTSSLMRMKKKADLSVLEGLSSELGFQEIVRTADEQVMGTILRLPSGAPVPLTRAPSQSALEAFEAFSAKGHLKLAFNFHHDGRKLTTKTLVQGTGKGSGAVFRVMWLFLRLPSGFTRKEWLRAIRSRFQGVAPA